MDSQMIISEKNNLYSGIPGGNMEFSSGFMDNDRLVYKSGGKFHLRNMLTGETVVFPENIEYYFSNSANTSHVLSDTVLSRGYIYVECLNTIFSSDPDDKSQFGSLSEIYSFSPVGDDFIWIKDKKLFTVNKKYIDFPREIGSNVNSDNSVAIDNNNNKLITPIIKNVNECDKFMSAGKLVCDFPGNIVYVDADIMVVSVCPEVDLNTYTNITSIKIYDIKKLISDIPLQNSLITSEKLDIPASVVYVRRTGDIIMIRANHSKITDTGIKFKNTNTIIYLKLIDHSVKMLFREHPESTLIYCSGNDTFFRISDGKITIVNENISGDTQLKDNPANSGKTLSVLPEIFVKKIKLDDFRITARYLIAMILMEGYGSPPVFDPVNTDILIVDLIGKNHQKIRIESPADTFVSDYHIIGDTIYFWIYGYGYNGKYNKVYSYAI